MRLAIRLAARPAVRPVPRSALLPAGLPVTLLVAAGALAVPQAGCTPDTADRAGSGTPPIASTPATGPAATATGPATTATSCPVTRPSGKTPPVIALTNLGSTLSVGGEGWIGNDALWVQLPPAGILNVQVDPDLGMPGTKFGWFRAKAGQVEVRARPLTGGPAEFRADVGTVSEYGPVGFTPSTLRFGRDGCWQVTGSVAGSRLVFVLGVVSSSTG
jgi:hypothetical protein